ncbi:septum formation initiator family protein [Pseudomonas aeruginosa]
MRLRSPQWLFPVLLLALAGLQYRLWVGEGSITAARILEAKIKAQREENDQLFQRNEMLAAEIAELKIGMETVAERARRELGMLGQKETLYILAK